MGELDVKRRSGFLPLLESARKTSGQVFMTATEENWPRELGKDLQRWEVKGGMLQKNSNNQPRTSNAQPPIRRFGDTLDVRCSVLDVGCFPIKIFPMRILSGIQPSGALHLGNYFGMMRPAIELQEKGEAFYFIANYHSMTSLFDAQERRKNTLDVALDFLACGLDPKRTVFFRQSDVPEVTELTWLLSTVTPMGLLERAHSYKDKIAKGIAPSHGLFAYPVLMAADILIYDSNVVPVGRDQKQHVEMTRDIAIKFNEQYGETFVIPEPQIRDEVAVVPGTDGQKMSKSYGNTIEIFGDEKAIRKKIMGIVMDSRTPAGTETRRRPESRHPTAQIGGAAGRGEGL